MITEFCMNCGAKIQYALNKPNFCSSCGTPLNKTTEASAQAPVEEEVQQEPEETFSKISKLDYSIDTNQNQVTFGDLISQASRDSKTEYQKSSVRPKAAYDPSEDVIKSTMQQCRSRKDPEDISG